MMTRRHALGAGLAVAALGTLASEPCRAGAARAEGRQKIDAFLIDETLAMPSRIDAFVRRRLAGTMPVVGVGLDAADHSAVRHLLRDSQALAGISTGATLFCIERLAQDHGMCLTRRSQHCAAELNGSPLLHTLSLTPVPPAAQALSADRRYRPSRDDGVLHVWVLEKPARKRRPGVDQEIRL